VSVTPYPPNPPSARPLLRRWLWTGSTATLFLLTGLVFATGLDAEIGVEPALIGMAAAMLPLGIVLPAVLWLDRFEAEPTRYLVTAFLWGACVATAGALVLNTSSMLIIAEVAGRESAQEVAAVVVAPVVEESLKGLGVLLVLLLRRREFDGVVDGIVYAATCAAGFAFAENILYLGRSWGEYGVSGLAVVLITRGLFGPFAHPMFTACTGVGLGIASTRSRGPLRVVAPVLGLLLAMTLHALWNGAAVLGAEGALTLYFVLQVPLFIAVAAFAVWARRREGRIIGLELSSYAAAGWFAPPEVAMLASLPLRRSARRWAAEVGGPENGRRMQRFQDQATELAFLRQRVRHGTAPPDAPEQEAALLRELGQIRAGLYAPPVGRPPA
jgi:RsiW-degrading membrane proteinase PrsW (M82 family)